VTCQVLASAGPRPARGLADRLSKKAVEGYPTGQGGKLIHFPLSLVDSYTNETREKFSMAESAEIHPRWETDWGFAAWVAEQRRIHDRPEWLVIMEMAKIAA
jgi:hypothetical protein